MTRTCSFVALASFAASAASACAWTRLSRLRTKATSARTRSLSSRLRSARALLFSFSMSRRIWRLSAARVSYLSAPAQLRAVLKPSHQP